MSEEEWETKTDYCFKSGDKVYQVDPLKKLTNSLEKLQIKVAQLQRINEQLGTDPAENAELHALAARINKVEAARVEYLQKCVYGEQNE